MRVAKKYSDELERIKRDVCQSSEYFKSNVKRYKEFIKFVYKTSLSSEDLAALDILKKPNIEFNVLEAYVSRLIGEFQQNEPEMKVSAADGVPVQMLTPEFLATLEVVEDHIRETLDSSANDGLKVKLMRDMLVGGFSVAHIYTDYVNSMSFEQNIYIERAFDPTLTGFDPMARDSHRGDGRYCFQVIPKTRDEFEGEFGKDATKNMSFTKSDGTPFHWSYKNQKQEIVLVVDFYEKSYRREKIAKLANGATILKKHYEPLVEKIRSSDMAIAPPVIIEERYTVLEDIVRYRVCENEVLDFTKTNYKHLPLVFFDGNGAIVYENDTGETQLMTRPYVYHAKGIQRLKNFAGQTVANEIENMKMTQWKAALESIPEKYLEGYKNPQQAQTLVYYAFNPDNPDQPLPPPMEVGRTPTPPIVQETFMGSDAVTQTILGAYDAAQGHIGAKNLSGKAIQMGAMQSSSAAMPYVQGFINGMNRLAQIYVDLLPKYYVTPRTLPVRKATGKREYIVINNQADPASIAMDFDPNNLNVQVEMGVNSSMQKQIALDTIVSLMQASSLFSEFINTDGLEVLLENVDIRGVEELKALAKEFMERKRAEQDMLMQQQQNEVSDTEKLIEAQTNIEMAKVQQRQQEADTKVQVEMLKTEQKERENQAKLDIEAAKVSIEEQKAYADFIKTLAEVEASIMRTEIEAEKARAEDARTAVLNLMESSQVEE